ncbi:MAG: exosome complex RNA-binding protein Csl4 [Candidatus Micrarchaeota archaeon]|nr:exosome complex RNA-binding protein Csl4 [Candidatus Micrarchaeota archaeon]
MVLPGDFLATSEELAGGEGTFEDEGTIYAAVGGKAVEDKAKKLVYVASPKIVSPLREGDLVYARVRNVYDQIAALEMQAASPTVSIPTINAFIRISEVSRGFAENFGKYIKVGDILKARVIEIKELGIYVTIKDQELGVVKAFCPRCRNEMEGFGRVFACMKCGARDERKAAGAEEEIEEGMERRGPPRGFGRDGGRGGGRGFGGREGGRGGSYRGGPRRGGERAGSDSGRQPMGRERQR